MMAVGAAFACAVAMAMARSVPITVVSEFCLGAGGAALTHRAAIKAPDRNKPFGFMRSPFL